MKRGGYAAILIVVFTAIVILVLIASFALSGQAPKVGTPTSTATGTPTSTPDPCAQKNMMATLTDFDKLSREFNDAFVLAQNTPSTQLSSVITDMQRIRREAQDYAIPVCLGTIKQYQISFMNAAIDASLVLYSKTTFIQAFMACANSQAPGTTPQAPSCANDSQVVQGKQYAVSVDQDKTAARQFSAQYTQEMANLLGVTLAPSPTLEAAVTPAPLPTPTP